MTLPSLLALVFFLAAQAPSPQTLVYYNARMALREGHANEALKLWLLRNTLHNQTGQVSAHDPDFRSITWAALGDLGLCQDGLATDETGVGLWPLALHNWLVNTRRRTPAGSASSPFAAFELGQQQRYVSVRDVLDAKELAAVEFRPDVCWAGRRLQREGGDLFGDLRDKLTAVRAQRFLLRKALQTLSGERVVGRAVVEARIFDLNLSLTELLADKARRERRNEAGKAREEGLWRKRPEGNDAPARPAVDPKSEEGRILKASLSWPAEEWMAMSPERRQFLFAQAVVGSEDPAATRALTLAIIDALIEERRGAELHSWIAHVSASDKAARELIWGGERGRRVLSLDLETGFRERSAIALERGVQQLSAGHMSEALRSLAYALSWSQDSRSSAELQNLSRRWLSYVAAQFRATDEWFTMLRSVVPPSDFAIVLEDQLWHAALGADSDSFERCVQSQRGRGALARRVEILRPLSQGDAATFLSNMERSLEAEPNATLRLLGQLVQQLQAEDGEVRAAHAPMLDRLRQRLEQHVNQGVGKRGRTSAETLIAQIRAIVEGVVGVTPSEPFSAARALSPGHEVFVGNLRVAPSDPLPWPFTVAEVEAPPVFAPLRLVPEEWRGPRGELVYGWRIGD